MIACTRRHGHNHRLPDWATTPSNIVGPWFTFVKARRAGLSVSVTAAWNRPRWRCCVPLNLLRKELTGGGAVRGGPALSGPSGWLGAACLVGLEELLSFPKLPGKRPAPWLITFRWPRGHRSGKCGDRRLQQRAPRVRSLCRNHVQSGLRPPSVSTRNRFPRSEDLGHPAGLLFV